MAQTPERGRPPLEVGCTAVRPHRLRVSPGGECSIGWGVDELGAHFMKQQIAVDIGDVPELGNVTLGAADRFEKILAGPEGAVVAGSSWAGASAFGAASEAT